MSNYLLVKAVDSRDAIEKSPVQIGDYVKVTEINSSSSGYGEFTIMVNVDLNSCLNQSGLSPVSTLNTETKVKPVDIVFSSFLSKIKAMNEMMLLDSNDVPTDLKKERLVQFKKIITEEIHEVDQIVDSYNEGGSDETMKEILDWFCDIIVYTASESRRWGLPLSRGLDAVMASQESKLVDGKPIHEGGKFIKGPNFVSPDAALLSIIKDSRTVESSGFDPFDSYA